MAIVLEAITHVFFKGRMIEPGEVFSADDEYGKRLIEGQSAKVHGSINSQSYKTDEQETLKKAFMALRIDKLKELADKNAVELSAEDTTKALITEKLIGAGVVIE